MPPTTDRGLITSFRVSEWSNIDVSHPIRLPGSRGRRPRRVTDGLGLEAADDVVDALTSDTARAMIHHLYAEPATASDLADAVDTSVQNVRYHLDRLGADGVVDVVGSWYSERGRETDVHGPRSEPLIVVAGGPDADETLQSLLADASRSAGRTGRRTAREHRRRP